MPELQTAPSAQPTFNLKTVLYVVTLIASAMAVSWHAVLISLLFLFGWVFIATDMLHRKGLNRLVVSVIAITYFLVLPGFVLLVMVVLPSSMGNHANLQHIPCSFNMRQIGVSLLNYENSHGQFPDSAIDVDGVRQSWRVALLPYIEQDVIRRAYDFSQAWNSKKNFPLAKIPIGCFQCRENLQAAKTPYKLVVGPDTLFDSQSPPTLDKCTDGLADTIILIEDTRDPIYWSEPTDIQIDDAVNLVKRLDSKTAAHRFQDSFGKYHYGINVVFGDGSVGLIGSKAHPEDVRRAFLCADGNPVQDNFREVLMFGRDIVFAKYGFLVALVIYVVLLITPAWSIFQNYKKLHQVGPFTEQ